MKSIKEKSEEYINDYYQKLGISKDEYPTDVVISKADFIAGANYVLEQIEKLINNQNWCAFPKQSHKELKELIEQLKKITHMKLEVGNRIFYQKNGEFYVDRIADILSTKEGTLYELVDYDWWCVTEDELLDESDERVRDYMCMSKDAMIKLSDVRNWLRYHARNYYESDSWSLFKDEDMVKDLCKAMLYE